MNGVGGFYLIVFFFLFLGCICAFFAQDGGAFAFDNGPVNGHGCDVVPAGDLIHDIEHDFFKNGT